MVSGRELGLAGALFEEGLDTDLGVLGVEDLHEELLLGGDGLGEGEVEAAADGLLGVGLRDQRAFG